MNNIRSYHDPIQKYIAIMGLQVHPFFPWPIWFLATFDMMFTSRLRFTDRVCKTCCVPSGTQCTTVLQGFDWKCGRDAANSLHSYSRWSMPKIWLHLSKSTWALHQLKREVNIMPPFITIYLDKHLPPFFSYRTPLPPPNTHAHHLLDKFSSLIFLTPIFDCNCSHV